ncbi:hypothetical protein BBJ28_00021391 [Nothophytophthora sp. Chile5]|nr:hypothetical protein BBJ28_00021391 [Nothophytophthora sp. Chile5]
MFAMFARGHDIEQSTLVRQLPGDRPAFMNSDEWDLLLGMCAADPTGRTSMGEVVHKLEVLDKAERKDRLQNRKHYEGPTGEESDLPVKDVTAYIIATAGKTLAEVLQDADELCDLVEEFVDVNRSVYKRLVDLYQQFSAVSKPLPVRLVEDFSMIVWNFNLVLEERSSGEYSVAVSVCASRTIANRNYGQHIDIDQLISSSSGILQNSINHRWQSTWQLAQRQQRKVMQSRIENPSSLLEQLNSNDDREEAIALMQYEARYHGGASLPANALVASSVLPIWFIPSLEVKRGQLIARGSFGAVYGAKWLGTDVVVKQVLTDQADTTNREQFRGEVDLWFLLNHKNLIELYGACHVGRPFFVCENAIGGTIVQFLKRNPHALWGCLRQAAMGLEDLHERGIIHGDLKGNNILVCMTHETDQGSATAKLADFGLSFIADKAAQVDGEGALGAFRWKAPECLLGNPPTFASDIYSFGMCIIEAATGNYPWGTTIPDDAVKINVAQERLLPPHPKNLSSSQWELITRMCAFDPQSRMNASAVARVLCFDAAFEDEGTIEPPIQDSSPREKPAEHVEKPDAVIHRESRFSKGTNNGRWNPSNRLPNVFTTEDRLGDYLIALRNEFRAQHSEWRRGLNLPAVLGPYEAETRVLVKLAATGHVVQLLLRFGRMLEEYMEVLEIPQNKEFRAWRDQLSCEREERVVFFNELLRDNDRLSLEMGDERQQMEVITLFKHGLNCDEEILTSDELDVMVEVYDRIVHHSGILLVGALPSWFLSPMELLHDRNVNFLDGVHVNKATTRAVVPKRGEAQEPAWQNEEEACLRQATIWADLRHPHVAKLLGGCHIGKQPFLVHEAAEPISKIRANANSWQPLLGWALGLQYLHERELGYKDFSDGRLLVRHFNTVNGVLRGLELEPIRQEFSLPLQRGFSDVDSFDTGTMETSLSDVGSGALLQERTSPSWSVPADVFAFGLAILNTRRWSGMPRAQELPTTCPAFLNEQEWDLIERMCAKNPLERVNMSYVVHQLQAFIKVSDEKKAAVDLRVNLDTEEETSEATTEEQPMYPQTINEFIVPKMHARIEVAMPRLESLYQEIEEANEMHGQVFARVDNLYAQLRPPADVKEAAAVMDGFVSVLNRFYLLLKRRKAEALEPSSSTVAHFCAARTSAQTIGSFHHDIDRLLTLAGLREVSTAATEDLTPSSLTSNRGNSSNCVIADIHDWTKVWNKMRRDQLRAFVAWLQDTPALKEHLSDRKAREEAQMLLQFEALKRKRSYPPSVLEAMAGALAALEELDGGEAAEAVPNWFIPPYEVELGDFIGRGSFAEVYHGKWLDTDVVVKRFMPASSSSSSDEYELGAFRQEADIWFMLNHENVVHLYGACHVGTPFFVCEPAKVTSLIAHVESQAKQRIDYDPNQKGGNHADVLRCLYLAGLGLQYLHDRGVVHGDLKGNNFMVGADEKNIKLSDFGLSVMKRQQGAKEYALKVMGAYRWKAPELLLGLTGPTVESDVFGFGMCIIELISGEFPWGPTMPDPAVKFHVAKGKSLPPRPAGFTDNQWSLIQRMSCFDPKERISLAAVVDMLYSFRFI